MRRLLLLTVFALGPVGLSAEATGTLRPGTVYHYVKSNLDGSDPWQVTTYVSSRTRLDVLKWGEGPGELVEVTADLDPSGCVAQRLEQWNLRDGTMALSMFGELSDDGRSLVFRRQGIPPIVVRGSARPLHPYGFDLQAVDVSPRCLGKTAGAAVLGLNGINPVAGASPPLVDYGPVRVEPLGNERLGDIPCRKVRLAGKGFTILAWFARTDGHVVRAESTRPDSDDWTSFRLELTRIDRMNPFEWQAFRREVLSKFVRQLPAPAVPGPAGDGGQR